MEDNVIKIILGVLLILGLGLLFTYPYMLLLNYVFSSSFIFWVFGVPAMTFWKIYALSIVTTWRIKAS